MKLLESHPSLTNVCRAVETRLDVVAELRTLELPIVLLSNFDSLPESQLADSFRLTPAAYQRSERRIIVNQQHSSLPPTSAFEAALAHEIAHALCHSDSIVMRDPEHGLEVSEEIVADLFACKWGFYEGLRQERLTAYGARYCEILELWPQEQEFIRVMFTWYQQRLAGILQSLRVF